MNQRNYDWRPLGVHGDPVPGDPGYVAQQANSMRTSADAMNSAATNLRRLEAPGTCSEAIAKIMVEAVQTASLLDEASSRYHSTAAALSSYAPALQAAQSESFAALQEAGPAHANEHAAYKKSVGLYWQAKTTLDPVEREHTIHQYHQAKAQRYQASASLNSAKARLHQAIEARDGAAQKAANDIESASSGGALNDSAWDKFADFMGPVVDAFTKVGDWIWKHIDEIALVLTIAAIALAWVPGLNVVLVALKLGTQALSVVKAGYTLNAGVAEGIRTGNWGNAGMGAAGLALSLVGGKAVGMLAKKVGGAVAKSVSSGVTKQLGKYNAWLKVGVQRKYNHLQHLLLQQQKDGGITIARALNAGRKSPYYHKAAMQIDEMYTGASAAARDAASKTDAILATVKGTDYNQAIKHAADDLARSAKHHDISPTKIAEVADDLGEAAGKVAEEVVKDAGEDIVEHAATWVDEQQRRLEQHRLTPTVCGAR